MNLPTFHCVYDTETNHKFIKKASNDGSLAVFDYEYEAIESQVKNTAVEEVYIITPKKLNKIVADSIRECLKVTQGFYDDTLEYAALLEEGEL